ncbi:MAG: family 43 glycosylhydrolase, partial [Planctomycetota bacterium]
ERVGTYANPLDVLLADPFALLDKGTYSLYATSSGSGYRVWSSPDLVNWRLRGHAFRRSERSFGRSHFWAPESVKYRGAYYLVYSARGRETSLRLCLAKADSPLGPFKDVAAPWCDVGKAMIDAHVFVDANGTPYLYYSLDCSENRVSEIWAVRLRSDLMAPAAKPVFCVKPSQRWEGPKWNEAPFVMRHAGTYYLMYSGNFYGSRAYAVGYATSQRPLGPWRKFDGNPILRWKKGVSGPGHHSVVRSRDGRERFIVYHTHQQKSGGGKRQLAIDRLRFVSPKAGQGGSARIVVDGPTRAPQPWPSGSPLFASGIGDDFRGRELDRSRWLVFGEVPGDWSLRDGGLVVRTRKGDIHRDKSDLANLFLQYAPHGDFTASVKVTFDGRRNYEQAFLIAWQDHNNYVRFSTAHVDGRRFEVGVEVEGEYRSAIEANGIGAAVHLRLTRAGDRYGFQVSRDGRAWKALGTTHEPRLVDLKIGLGATATISDRRPEAVFERFRIEATRGAARRGRGGAH